MAYVISDFGVFPKVRHKTQVLSCMQECQGQLKNKMYDADDIQRRINESAKVRARLDYEVKKRYEKIKNIDFLG